MELLSTNHHVQRVNWSMSDLHSHSHYEIYYLYEGERSFFLSDAIYILCAPCLVVIPPYVLHKTDGGPFKRINIDVSPEFLNPYQREVLNSANGKILAPSQENETGFLDVLFSLHNVKDEEKHSSEIKSALFSYIVYKISLLDELNKTLSQINRKALPDSLLSIIDYLNKNFHEKVTLQSLSGAFYCSKASLIYNFKRYLSITPIDYLLNLRLNKARDLLLTTKKTVSEISDYCGFSSPNYFCFIFKKKEGLSPSAFRNKIKK